MLQEACTFQRFDDPNRVASHARIKSNTTRLEEENEEILRKAREAPRRSVDARNREPVDRAGTMAYSTIPADLESEATLLNKPTKTKTSTKALVFGAALAAFVLGAVAATATSTTPSASTAFHTKDMTCTSPSWMDGSKTIPPAFTDFQYMLDVIRNGNPPMPYIIIRLRLGIESD